MLLSDQETKHVADLARELDLAIQFVGTKTQSELADDITSFYATQRAMLNAAESCIRLEKGKSTQGSFTRLFPDFEFNDIRIMANTLRHDYGTTTVDLVYNEMNGRLSKLHLAAMKLLEAKRKSLKPESE